MQSAQSHDATNTHLLTVRTAWGGMRGASAGRRHDAPSDLTTAECTGDAQQQPRCRCGMGASFDHSDERRPPGREKQPARH